jgi:thermospermine synthase
MIDIKTDVKAYTAHVPSFADTWGWVMASDHEFDVEVDEMDRRIEERVNGELMYLNAPSFVSAATLNKTISLALEKETEVYSEENARFIHGHGVAYRHI